MEPGESIEFHFDKYYMANYHEPTGPILPYLVKIGIIPWLKCPTKSARHLVDLPCILAACLAIFENILNFPMKNLNKITT